MIKEGDTLPRAELLRIGAEGPEPVDLGAKLEGRRVVIFAVPGAFTPTCHSAHMPSFVRNAQRFRDAGIDEIICVAVNDPFVLQAWERATGADDAGITVLGDPDGSFTAALGLTFDAPAAGFINRSRRYAMLVEDGTVRTLNLEEGRGCEISSGEALLDSLQSA